MFTQETSNLWFLLWNQITYMHSGKLIQMVNLKHLNNMDHTELSLRPDCFWERCMTIYLLQGPFSVCFIFFLYDPLSLICFPVCSPEHLHASIRNNLLFVILLIHPIFLCVLFFYFNFLFVIPVMVFLVSCWSSQQ